MVLAHRQHKIIELSVIIIGICVISVLLYLTASSDIIFPD